MADKKALKVVVFGNPGFARQIQPSVAALKKTGLKASLSLGANEKECLKEIEALRPDVVVFWGIPRLSSSAFQELRELKNNIPVINVVMAIAPEGIRMTPPVVVLQYPVPATQLVAVIHALTDY